MANIVMDIEEVQAEADKHASGLPGRRLREAREQQGLHVADVAAALLLTEEQIQALEENDFDYFSAPLFVRGYLRKYAALLDIPDAPLIEAFEHIGLEGPSLQAELTSSIPRPKRFNLELAAGILVAVGVVILGLVWLFSDGGEEEMVAQSSEPVQEAEAAAEELSSLSNSLSAVEETRPEAEASPPAASVVETAPPAPIAEAPPAEQPVRSASVAATMPETGPEAAPAPDRLLLQFNDDSWVEITDARGERLFFNLGRAGQTRLLEGQAPFEILLGNAPAVQIEYNGVPYNHKRFNRKNVARFRLGDSG